MVGLKAVANRPVGTFSKGMARRIGLAQALINDPDLLILDEPTTGLDPIGTRQIKDLILELAKRGKTVLLCSHLLADVEDVCDRIAILYGGKIQSEGKVRELLQQTHKTQITTGSISATAIEKIKQIVQNEQDDCVITSPMDKLETFFIRTVASAREQAQPTSGVVSDGTYISDFLTAEPTEKARRAEILDKLVSASLSPQTPPEPPTTEQPTPVETYEPKPDEQLLEELTRKSEPPKPKPVVKPQPVESEAAQHQQNKDSILDQLTDRATPQNQQTDKPDKSHTGGTSDA
jgi:ABC-2 type transport system ATP-binding protein